MTALTINFSQQEGSFQQQNNDTVLRAALRAGISFPYECKAGGCGSCKFELIEGEVQELWPSAPGLSRRDLRKNKKLACQCVAKTNLSIKVNIDSQSTNSIRPSRIKVKFVKEIKLTGDMSEFVFQSNQPADFLPGQFALFQLPNVQGERAYSMSNLANDDGYWTFIIKNMSDGAGSDFLFQQLTIGTELSLDGPYGLAFLRTEVKRDVICIGGGSGLSPMISIARAIDSFTAMKDIRLHLFYGGRGPKDICTADLIAKLQNQDERITCYSACSDEELIVRDQWHGETGFIHSLVEKTFSKNLV
ncbi:MAG: 2Fe-2S iron-sulfur cluster binding domain-containing protein, partial [Kangiellaceae bacterium]|nr:2Fe-2S iron-sulfur cluster binding domain-containing protein [Kangiellaceae bacterium]